MSPNKAPLVEIRNLAKAFGGNKAVDDVSLDLYPGEVVAILGHNGAGKSTLIKMLAGAYEADSGEFIVDGEQAVIRNPRDARKYGIETIFQTLALADNLDAPANIFLGREKMRSGIFLNEDVMEAEARKVLDRLKLNLPSVKEKVSNMSGGQRQAIAIARALYFDAKVLIMDEPTAALGPQETAMVASLTKQLKTEGLGIFLISHDLHDVFDLADRISVLKNGKLVGTVNVEDVTQDEVLAMIIAGKLPKVLEKA